MEIIRRKTIYNTDDLKVVKKFLFLPKMMTIKNKRTKVTLILWLKTVYILKIYTVLEYWKDKSYFTEDINLEMVNRMLLSYDNRDKNLALKMIEDKITRLALKYI